MTSKHGRQTTGSQLVKEYADNIKGKVILVTGTSPGGIGALYCAAVAKGGPSMIILAGRTVASIQKTGVAVARANPDVTTKFLALDLGSFNSIREAAAQVNSWDDVPYIDLLVNNAGIMAIPYGKTEDGFERQFGTNHLGHFLFTNLIMPKILASEMPRIVMVSSDGHRLNPIRWTDYNFSDGKTYNKWFAYGQSKTANNLMAISLAEKLGSKGLLAFAIHPGVYSSNLSRNLDWVNGDAAATLKAADIAMGTRFIHGEFDWMNEDEIIATHVYASFTEDLRGHNGVYLQNCRIADQYQEEVWPWGKDPVDADRLWTLSEKLVGQEFKY